MPEGGPGERFSLHHEYLCNSLRVDHASSVLIIGAVFVGVVALVVGVAMFMRDQSVSQMEDRLGIADRKGDRNDPSSLSDFAQMLSKERMNRSAIEIAALAIG